MTYRYHQPMIALMIDDDVDFLSLVKRILRTFDVDLITAENKNEFFKQIQEIRPQFCLVDLNLNGVAEGFSIIQELRSKDYNAPLFVISAESSSDSVTHALEIGATDYFLKPLNREILEKKLSYYIKDITLSKTNKPHTVMHGGPHTAQIEFPTTLDSIDEFGIKFKCPHLLPKGTLVKFLGKEIKEMTSQEKVLVSVMTSNLDLASQQYVYYAEFENLSADSMNEVRKWLGAKEIKSGK